MRAILLGLSAVVLFTLTGCLYPQSERGEYRVPLNQYVAQVQQAVDRYYEDTQVLPIKTKETEEYTYDKYVIDFSLLLTRGYLDRVPVNAFEQGGSHLYVIVSPETDPQVKLYDIFIKQTMNDLQQYIFQYRLKNIGEMPLDQQVAGPYYTLDYSKLKVDEVHIQSPYSNQMLPIIINTETGLLGIDYSIDIGLMIQNGGIKDWESGKDLRELLIANSLYVPVESYPYAWQNGEPVLSKKE